MSLRVLRSSSGRTELLAILLWRIVRSVAVMGKGLGMGMRMTLDLVQLVVHAHPIEIHLILLGVQIRVYVTEGRVDGLLIRELLAQFKGIVLIVVAG